MFFQIGAWTVFVLSSSFALNIDHEDSTTERVSTVNERSQYQTDLVKIVARLEDRIAEQDKQIQHLVNKDKERDEAFEQLLKKLEEKEDKRNGKQNEKLGNDKVKRVTLDVAENRRGIQETDKIAFMAYMDHNIDHMSVGHTIKANKVLLNDGAAYNHITGLFTAPVTGVYFFNYRYNSHYRMTLVGLFVDGKNVVDAIAVPQDSIHEVMSGNTALIQVQAGQSVWLEDVIINDGEIYTTPAARYATFSGFLLYRNYENV